MLVILVFVVSLFNLWGQLTLASPAIIVRILRIIRLRSPFFQVASVSRATILFLTIIVSLFRLRIPAILSRLGSLPARWPAIGYDTIDRIGRTKIRPYTLGTRTW